MSILFLDASALVKLYIEELGSEELLEQVDRPGVRLALSSLSRVECRSALRRKQRLEKMRKEVVDDLLLRFDSDFVGSFLIQPIDNHVIDEAVRLTDAKVLKAYDAIQLASCMRLRQSLSGEDVTFACADRQLMRAADEEGVSILDVSGDRQ